MTEYTKIAQELNNYYKQNQSKYDALIEESERIINEFQNKFSSEKIADLKDSEVLNFIFGDKEDNSLFHNLEFDENLRQKFGSIKGGFASKRYLYKTKGTNNWKITQGNEINSEDATKKALDFRDKIVKACNNITSVDLNTLEDYKNLNRRLDEILGSFSRYIIVRKYLYLLYPNYFYPCYREELLDHILYRMNIKPEEHYYELIGQLHLIREESQIPPLAFYSILGEKFGFDPLTFYQFDLDGESDELIKNSQRENFLALSCNIKENFSELLKSKRKSVLSKKLEEYFSGDAEASNVLADEIINFLNPKGNPVFVIKKNDQLLGFFTVLDDYIYSAGDSFPHRRKGNWIYRFSQDDVLPQIEDSNQITNKENILFLYNRFYKNFSDDSTEELNVNNNTESEKNIRFKTGFESEYPRNLLLFGAPSTGKSFKLNQQKDILLDSNSDYERVTFHPDYTYANFVGSYKPYIDKENKSITYKFVPGPFARIYAKAIKNTKTDKIRPYLLIIEELNRSDTAAVFGDIFQLLDRTDNVSEYPITTSEEFRDYLIEEVGGDESDFKSIRLPDNLFIWATMNNADQGVHPLDTAFKRRWDYKPLSINENDDQIEGKYVFLGKNKEQKVEWNKLRKAINQFLSKERINEDKQLGPFFLNVNEIPSKDFQLDRESFIEAFKNKILIYLFEDTARRIRQKIFSGSQNNYRYSDLCEEFDQKGIKIFDQEIIKQTEPEFINIEELE